MIEDLFSISYFSMFALSSIYIVLNSRKNNTILGIFIIIYLCVGAGFRTDGWDWDNWVRGIDIIRGEEDFIFRITVARDPVWYAIVSVTKWISENKWLPILTIVSISAIIKYQSIRYLRGNTTLFFSLYGFLLAPELDFSAMRSSLAGAFLIGVCIYEQRINKYFRAALSILSHQSSAVHLLWFIVKPIKFWHFVVIVIVFFITIFFGQNLLVHYIDRLVDYKSQQSNYGAIYMPLLSCIFWIMFHNYKLRKLDIPESNMAAMIYIIYGFSLSISLLWVTVSHRVLELGHILFLALIVCYNKSTKLTKIQLITFGLFSLMLISRHINDQNYSVVRW